MDKSSYCENNWELCLVNYKDYALKFGYVVQQGIAEDDLYTWYVDQRANFKFFSKEIKIKLKRAGFPITRNDLKWHFKYLELKQYYNIHGHTCIPSTDKDNSSLHLWVMRQRRRRPFLSQEKIELLDRLNFNYSVKNKKWDEMIFRYSLYLNRASLEDESIIEREFYDVKLWLGHLRKNRSKLTAKQMNDLKVVGIEYSPINPKWFTMYELVKAFFHKTRKHKFIKLQSVNLKAYLWLNSQYRNFDFLEANKKDLILKLGDPFFIKNEEWLFVYYEINGALEKSTIKSGNFKMSSAHKKWIKLNTKSCHLLDIYLQDKFKILTNKLSTLNLF